MPANREKPVNKNYVILGLGQIGCSLAAALRSSGKKVNILGIDLSWKSYYRFLCDSFSTKLPPQISDDALIIVSTPLQAAVEICFQLIHRLTAGQLVITTGSLLQPFFHSAFQSSEIWRKSFVAGHPFAGTTYSGKKAIQPALFRRRPFFYAHFEGLSRQNRRRFFEFLKSLSARPKQISPEKHDRLMAAVSNFPALLAYLLFARVVEDAAIEKEFLGSGFFKTSSLVLTPSAMFADIVSYNWQNIQKEIDNFIFQLKLFQESGLNFKERLQKINTLAEALRRNYEQYFQCS